MAKSTIGLRDVVYAMLTTDEKGQPAAYGAIKPVVGAIDAALTANAENTPQYADDGKFDDYSSLGDMTMALELTALPSSVQEDWLGHSVDSNGVVIRNKDDQGAHFALGWRSMMTSGKYKYVWAYKSMASIPDETYHTTEEGSVTYQTRTVDISFSPRESDGNWQAQVDETEDGVNATVITGWLSGVYEPAATP